jgi:3-dehydroquinate dehydratase-2
MSFSRTKTRTKSRIKSRIKTVLVINGPNMDRLGNREPGIYGTMTLDELNAEIKERADKLDIKVQFFQSNHEGDIVDKIGSAKTDGIIINPAAYTHTSIALSDTLAAYDGEAVEVHLSNIFSREDFRSKSLTAPACRGAICGFGGKGYLLALEALGNLR